MSFSVLIINITCKKTVIRGLTRNEIVYYRGIVKPFFFVFWIPNWISNWISKAVFEVKSTVGAGTKKRLSKGVQRPFKRRVRVSICRGQENGLKANKIKEFCWFQAVKLNLWYPQLNFCNKKGRTKPPVIKPKLKQIVLFVLFSNFFFYWLPTIYIFLIVFFIFTPVCYRGEQPRHSARRRFPRPRFPHRALPPKRTPDHRLSHSKNKYFPQLTSNPITFRIFALWNNILQRLVSTHEVVNCFQKTCIFALWNNGITLMYNVRRSTIVEI